MPAQIKNRKNKPKPGTPGFSFPLVLLFLLALSPIGNLYGQDIPGQAARLKEEALAGLKQQEWKKAETKAYEASQLFLGENLMASYLECLLLALQAHVAQNETEAAKRGYRKVSEMANEHLGTASVIQIEALLRLADVYESELDTANALDIHLKVMADAEKALGKKHPLMQQNYRWLQDYYLKTGKKKEASAIGRKRR